MPRRTKEEAEKTRDKIREAALDLFCEKGYSQTSFIDIAKAIGLTRGAVYWHYKEKKDLLIDLINRMFERELKLIRAKVPEVETWEDLRNQTLEKARLFEKDEAMRKFFMFLSLQMEWAASKEDAVSEFIIEVLDDVERFLKKAQARGELRDGVSVQAAMLTLISITKGSLDLYMTGYTDQKPRQTFRTGIDIFIRGIRKETT